MARSNVRPTRSARLFGSPATEPCCTSPRSARFLIRGGREIVVEPAAGASERNVRLFLLGSALRRACCTSAASCPSTPMRSRWTDSAVAFSGHSGAGKSTIAAWFHDRGHRILTDDVCVIGFDESGRALAYPGIPRLRLWREALEASGRDAANITARSTPWTNMTCRANAARSHRCRSAAIYLLRQAERRRRGRRSKRLQGVDGVETLVSNTYRGAYLRTIGRTGEHLAACLRVARQVPVFRADAALGLRPFRRAGRLLLEAHARGAGPGGGRLRVSRLAGSRAAR